MGHHIHVARIAALALLLVCGPSQADILLSFGLYTSNKPTSMVKQFRPVLDLMEQEMTVILGEPVEIRMQVAKDYSQGIEHLASGKVDFSRFGPASYIEAKRANGGLRILAMEREGGDKVFYGIIAVAKDSPVRSVADLKGKSFAFGNDQSTIGRYLSQQYLRNHGIYSSDLSRFDYLGRHDTVGTAVGAGHFDAGALNEATFDKLVAAGVPIRELARFPNVTKPWIAREGLPDRIYDALRKTLLDASDPLLQETLKIDGFVPGDDGDFADIRASIEENGRFFAAPTAVGGVTGTPAAPAKSAAEAAAAPDADTTSAGDAAAPATPPAGRAGPAAAAPGAPGPGAGTSVSIAGTRTAAFDADARPNPPGSAVRVY